MRRALAKGQVYAGQQPAIIDPEFLDQVQRLPKESTTKPRDATPKTKQSLLTSMLCDETGARLNPEP